jgi:hypothetical protein
MHIFFRGELLGQHAQDNEKLSIDSLQMDSSHF